MKKQLQWKKFETLLLMKELAEKCFVIFDFLLSGMDLFSKCVQLYKKRQDHEKRVNI